jgi:hypothetical protein
MFKAGGAFDASVYFFSTETATSVACHKKTPHRTVQGVIFWPLALIVN